MDETLRLADQSMHHLVLENVSKRFGAIVANDRVTLHVNQGEIVGLIGPNGSGKTTLFNSIVGHHRTEGGSVRFGGADISGRSTAEIARRGLLRTFQRTRVYPSLTCLENLYASIPPSFMNVWRLPQQVTQHHKARADEWLDLMGLGDVSSQEAGKLSFGQQRLLELGMVLMNEPKMLLLDEPTAGINPAAIDHLVDKLHELTSRLGLTLFIIEHNIPVIMGLASRIYCMHRGAILAEGSPDQIRAHTQVIEAYLGDVR
jgi:branched-chain amino acid transport system ATP-binding protein